MPCLPRPGPGPGASSVGLAHTRERQIGEGVSWSAPAGTPLDSGADPYSDNQTGDIRQRSPSKIAKHISGVGRPLPRKTDLILYWEISCIKNMQRKILA